MFKIGVKEEKKISDYFFAVYYW